MVINSRVCPILGVGLRVRNIETPVSAGLGDIWQDTSFKLFWYYTLPTGSASHAIFWEVDMGRL